MDLKVKRKKAHAVGEAIIKLLQLYGRSINSDNGRELAHRYVFWARGTNENANALTRQYFKD